jgi:hypothetical protein
MNQLDDKKTIVLRSAVTENDTTIAELNLREPTAREIDKLTKDVEKQGPITGMILLIATISGLQKPTIDQIGARDFKDAQLYLASFLGYGEDQNSLQTGAA